MQTIHRVPKAGERIEADKKPLRHLARFILIGLYSGTRAGAIAAASPTPAIGRSFIDLERGIYYRRAEELIETDRARMKERAQALRDERIQRAPKRQKQRLGKKLRPNYQEQ